MTTGRRKVASTSKLARIYGPGDPRAERNSRLADARQRERDEALAAVEAAVAEIATPAVAGLSLTDLVGTSFPEGPVNGQPFIRTDLDCDLFKWDETREKWLSENAATPSYTNGTTALAGVVLRLFQGPNGTTSLGYRLEWDATLTDVVASRTTSGAATEYDIRAGAVVMHTHTLGSGVVTSNEAGIDVDFASGDVVNVLLATDMTGGGTCTLRLRRRAS